MKSKPANSSVLIFCKEQWWLCLLVITLCFAFPNKLGLKVDAAAYGALARKILGTGKWWPLGLSPEFFPEFYDHPPGVIWIMTCFLWLGQNHDWFVHLFGRLCTLGAYVTGFAIVLQFSEGKAKARCVAFAVILTSWLQWLKTASVGQLDGPVTFVGMLTLYLALLLTDRKQSSRILAAFCALGFIGFLFKGVVYLLFVFAAGLYFGLRRPGSLLRHYPFLIAGVATALGFLALLDHSTGTHFYSGYFLKQVAGTVVTGEYREASAWSFSNLPRLIYDYIRGETQFAFLWSLPCWLTILWLLCWERRRFKSSLLLGAFCFYATVNGAIAVSTAKLPSWSVIGYPMGALLLSECIPDGWIQSIENFRISKYAKILGVSLVLLFAVLPYPLIETKWGRGEEWKIHSQWVRKTCNDENPFIYVNVQGEFLWTEHAYRHFYITPFVGSVVVSLKDVLSAPCRGGALAAIGSLIHPHDSELLKVGWTPEGLQVGSVRFYHCVN